jgi:hypothetical protein
MCGIILEKLTICQRCGHPFNGYIPTEKEVLKYKPKEKTDGEI